jgi:hypothetical protein
MAPVMAPTVAHHFRDGQQNAGEGRQEAGEGQGAGYGRRHRGDACRGGLPSRNQEEGNGESSASFRSTGTGTLATSAGHSSIGGADATDAGKR